MTHDIHTLILWIRVVVIIAAACATALPVIYAILFPWYSRVIGRLYMVTKITYAVTIDLTALFMFWQPKNILVVFWVNAIAFTAIAIVSLLMTVFIWRLRYSSKKGNTNAAQR